MFCCSLTPMAPNLISPFVEEGAQGTGTWRPNQPPPPPSPPTCPTYSRLVRGCAGIRTSPQHPLRRHVKATPRGVALTCLPFCPLYLQHLHLLPMRTATVFQPNFQRSPSDAEPTLWTASYGRRALRKRRGESRSQSRCLNIAFPCRKSVVVLCRFSMSGVSFWQGWVLSCRADKKNTFGKRQDLKFSIW